MIGRSWIQGFPWWQTPGNIHRFGFEVQNIFEGCRFETLFVPKLPLLGWILATPASEFLFGLSKMKSTLADLDYLLQNKLNLEDVTNNVGDSKHFSLFSKDDSSLK